MFEEKEKLAKLKNLLLTSEKLSQHQRNVILAICADVDRGITSTSSATNVLLNIYEGIRTHEGYY